MAKLLVVEDDPDVAECLTSILEDEGHQVRVARDGREGLERVAEDKPDLALLDVEMPVLDGPGMACELFLHNCGHELIPIVLLSGVANLKQVAERVGTVYYLAKPYHIDAVTALIQRALTERRPAVPRLRTQE
jgi:CheY-like chemotaxis protein